MLHASKNYLFTDTSNKYIFKDSTTFPVYCLNFGYWIFPGSYLPFHELPFPFITHLEVRLFSIQIKICYNPHKFMQK